MSTTIPTIEPVSNETEEKIKEQKRRNRKLLWLITFFTALLVTVATYAWLSSSLNVKIKFFEMTVQSDSGLFISLDAVNFGDTVVISQDTVVLDLYELYPNHTNQWSGAGMWPVSSIGIKDSNSDKFAVYEGHLMRTKSKNPNGSPKRILNTTLLPEDTPSTSNVYIAFDVFLKNASGSPKPDNLYFEENTYIDYEEETTDVTKEEMSGIMNSVRIGLVHIADVPHETPVSTIQNLKCNNACEMLIFEPYKYNHSAKSIKAAEDYNVTLVDGEYVPTYAIIAEGKHLEHTNGHVGTGIPLITSHFKEQVTITESDFVNPIFQIPNGISKYRVYVWIEGQDIDSLETYSKGAAIDISIEFIKDLAGYE